MGLCFDLFTEDPRRKHVRSLVQLSGEKYVAVDSCYTKDHGYETMVFAADSKGHILDWMDLDAETYATVDEMMIGHKAMCKKWSAK